MKIIIITQNEPFYLGQNLKYLFGVLSKDVKVVGCVVNSVSPFGKKENFYRKTIKTLKVFGPVFFMYYSIKFVFSKLFKPSLKKLLKENRVPEIQLEGNINSETNLAIIRSYNPDLLVSILGNQIFKKPLIDLAPQGCINLHTALLPKYRGLMPTFWVLKNNETHTGVSVFFVNEGIDSGPIILQKKVEIGNRTHAALIKHTKKMGMELIVDAIAKIQRGKFEITNNPDSEMSYYSFPTRKDVQEFKRSGKKFF